ncbi:Lrp/AsnC family transcriptional regulator [Clostridium neuense]|uniref:Lrp/AsnC family transcriptional regulator n=1 Tax=Clostridium neuense TaxID=1728934 RepID=A0ABW8TER8_9CLOT
MNMIDKTDTEILNLLIENSRAQWQEIGDRVHLTGQAVKNRINKMEKLNIIEGYTLKVNLHKLGKSLIAFITVFMKSSNHSEFKKYILNNSLIIEATRISGDGCYMLKAAVLDDKELTKLLDEILEYGNYKVNLAIENVK